MSRVHPFWVMFEPGDSGSNGSNRQRGDEEDWA
jgi:hypothetical protein